MGRGEVGGHRTFLGTPRRHMQEQPRGGQVEKRTATDPPSCSSGERVITNEREIPGSEKVGPRASVPADAR